ncbi:hypothetical protein ACJ41O_006732 [Fusarium nematophilum]
MAELDRNAFGEAVSFGTLFDTRSDEFLPASILSRNLPLDLVATTTPCPKTETCVSHDGTYATRFSTLGVTQDSAASILSGLFMPRGSGVYLRDALPSTNELHGALRHRVTTVQQQLGLGGATLRDHIDLAPVQDHEATHVVTGITWGMESVISMRHRLPDAEPPSKAEDAFRRDLGRLEDVAKSNGSLTQMELQLDFIIYTNGLINQGIIAQNVEDVSRFIQLVPDHIQEEYDGKGWPISYKLLPLTLLQYFGLPMARSIEVPTATKTIDDFARFIHLFDEFAECEDRLVNYQAFLASHQQHVAEDHVQAVSHAIDLLAESRNSTRTALRDMLVQVRSGTSDGHHLSELYDNITSTDNSPRSLSAIVGQETETLGFVSGAIAAGASYIGHNGLSLSSVTKPRGGSGCYTFLFSKSVMKDKQLWDENCALLAQLLSQPGRAMPVFIVDCDAANRDLEAPHISQYLGGQEVISDLLDHHQFMAGKCFARYDQGSIDTTAQPKPVKRRFVKIPCPGSGCDPSRKCEWICHRCFAPIECGFTDEYVYCDCGRSAYSSYDFKCNGEGHGPGFEKYRSRDLKALLMKLDQSDCLNILILGETGVGKSTFINGFVNYLSYKTLDEAKVADSLAWVIPCSFSTQVMDRDAPDREIEEKVVRVGSRDDEADGRKGDSATQQTAVYPVTIGSVTYRLIDTPGIGDTRGLSYDKKNMADILETLSSYDELHGILILLKSNNSRLNTTFRFCIKELLVHLHRSAATNMAFGFTNTRISNYTPGDTFAPLKTLLAEHSEIGLTLTTSTTYCFDSESFRYLAAYKDGFQLPNEEDFRRSWEHSRREAQRLLDHFKGTPPHRVNSTISLNGARQLISELTKPMGDISQLIRTNITMLEDKKRELKDTRLTTDSLRKKLHLEKIQFNSKALRKPRTVCAATECCDFKDSGKDDGEVVRIYKTHCHPECYLENVTKDVIADPGLINCWAIDGNNCHVCSHHWQQHLHVLYELKEARVQVKNTAVEQQLRANVNDVTLRESGIKHIEQLQEEYKQEHRVIQEAAARFGLFLKKYAMTPINDATVDYINMLIRDEEAKIAAGRQIGTAVDLNVKKLKALEEDKQAHIELVDTLTRNLRAPRRSTDQLLSETGVADLVTRLYKLKHFGNNLRNVKNTITSAQKATYRERPYRVQQHGRRGVYSAYEGVAYGEPARVGASYSVTGHGAGYRPRGQYLGHGGGGGRTGRQGGLAGWFSSFSLR